MKSTTHLLNTIAIVLLTNCATSHAASWLDHTYVHGDLGPAFTQNTTFHERGIDISSGPFVRSGQATFGTRIRGDLSLGYTITKAWAVELEAGAIWAPDAPNDNEFDQIPVTLNVLYQVPLNKYCNLYFGAGAGGVVSIFQFRELNSGFRIPPLLSDTSVAFGYQAQAGIKYAVSRHIEIGLGYKFLGMDGDSWNFGGPVPGIHQLSFDNLYTHTVLLSFNLKF
jgi:opacity protein-like surface antigen